jgi:hypothetical protein
MDTTTIHTETVTWTLTSGKQASVTVSMVHEIETLGHDDHMGAVTRDNGLKVKVEGRAEGHGVVGNSYNTREVPEAYRAKGFVATVGKLAIPGEVATRIEAALNACTSHPAYVAQEEVRAARRAEHEADDAMTRRIYATA